MKNLVPYSTTSTSPHDYCEDCHDTGFVGDNGPGVRGNREYARCECNPAARAKRKLARWAKPSTLQLVKEFHEAFGVRNASKPDLSDDDVNLLRTDLIQEELNELRQGIAARDPVAVLDALTDLQYVLDGTYLALGFANVKDAAFEEVHRSNMSKLGADGRPIRREDGKVLKGPNYTPPNLNKFVNQ